MRFTNWFLSLFLGINCSLLQAQILIPLEAKGDTNVASGALFFKDSTALKSYVLGQFDPNTHPDFEKIGLPYASNTDLVLRKETLAAFKLMHAAAAKEGISLTIISATRNFYRQKQIWEAKWNGERLVEGKNLAKEVNDPAERATYILLYSSMPGTSRHHWGTDIDINNLEDAYFQSGKGKKEYEWLVQNAPRFGFCQPYTPKGADRPHGYEEEKWHWTYMPVSIPLTRLYPTLVQPTDITGFKGSETALPLSVITRYVLGIAPACK